MTLRIQIIIGVIILIGLLYIVNLIRKNRIELRYALSWLGVGFIVLIFDIFPVIMNKLSNLIGIASPVNMIFFMGFGFSLVIILTLTVAASSAVNCIKKLTQRIAILEKRIRELEDKSNEDTVEK